MTDRGQSPYDAAPPAGRRAGPGTRRRGANGGAQSGGGMSRFFVVLALWLVVCWGTVGALLAPELENGWLTVLAVAAATTLPLPLLVWSRRSGHYPGRFFRLLVLRPFWYAQLLLPLLAAAGALGAALGFAFGRPALAGRAAMLAIFLAYVVLMAFGWAGSRQLVVKRLLATWPDLPDGLEGMRIVQISDTHVGPHTSRRHLDRVAALVRASNADLVAVTGDLVDDHALDVDAYAAALGGLDAPLGVFAVPGNHDVYAGWSEVRRRLEALPVTVLVNGAVILRRNGAHFAVVGTGDPAGASAWADGGGGGGSRAKSRGRKASAAPDIPAALATVPSGMFVVALAHNPALWPELAKRGVALTLSGHTHWGQFALPSLGWSLASPFLEFAMGVHREGRSLLYIHPGTNFWGIPFRLGTPPEVALITLQRGTSPTMRRG
ncbi:MAG TPA: metallophosphoesterase [Gemmatimonadaceae bacterium]|nr:metallophosphoesterase [Gemmatimonadaceae bacterium]